jgi:hypothetical protein
MSENKERTVEKRFPGSAELLSIGDLTIDTSGRQVRKEGEDLALTAREFDLLLRGTDPRHLERNKIFSAFPVKHNDVLQGYLYAVLGGAKYDELANTRCAWVS